MLESLPSYTVATLLSMLAVICVELFWLRTGIFRSLQYWLAMLIMFSFQVPVDGWLTKLSAPIVIYAPEHMSGVRWPWNIPIEDFGFGFAMLTLTLIVWKRLGQRQSKAEKTEPVPSTELNEGH